MRYSKIVVENMFEKRSFLMIFICCFILVLFLGIDSIKGTRAGFGCLSACMNAPYEVIYSSNYPGDIDESDLVTKRSCESHKVFDNMFDVPDGYSFSEWNTAADGSGTSYYAYSCITLSSDITLYAQWLLLPVDEDEVKTIVYGDLDDNGNIDENDYLLLEKYLLDQSILNEEMVLRADVNGDEKVDEIDADIIKQVYLGTNGYTGYLPNNIVPIYSLYEGTIEGGNGEGTGDNESSGNGTVGSGTGSSSNSSSGGGSSSNGNGNSNNKPNNGTSNDKKPSNNNSNKNNNDIKENLDNNEETEEDNKIPVIYNFKFMVDDREYANTSCETVTGSTCQLVPPKNEPIKKGYKFTGWSLDKDCPGGRIFTNPILVNASNTYYACFIINASTNNNHNFLTVGLMIVTIWGVAIGLIYYLIKKFKKVDSNN